jgi:uncharacterized membrane protein YphA (DoxX/SURF4 family)
MTIPIKTFIPLIFIVSLIIVGVVVLQLAQPGDWHDIMRYFMGLFFLVFGMFKVVRLPAFVDAYRMYDLLAQRSRTYAYAYPILELILGYSYLINWQPKIVAVVTFILMSVSAVGVIRELVRGRDIECACLGTVFKLPMTWVTIIEDLLMAAMALVMFLF